MQGSLLLTTFIMGLAGGPHCIAMCGAACGAISKDSNQNAAQFQGGRLLGYSSLGAVAATSVNGIAWFSSQTSALHPIWTFFHVLVLSWGLILLASARQPAWADQMGYRVWQRVRLMAAVRGGSFMTGMLWAFMPCGLLYSAVLVASLSGSALQGALGMSAFAVGSSLSLLLGPRIWQKLKHGNRWFTEARGMRLAGLLLAASAGWAIWMDITHQGKIFCSVN